MKIELFNTYVLIDADVPEQTTKGGLIIAEQWKTLPPTGTVVAVGPDVDGISAGERVVFSRFGALPAQIDPVDNKQKNWRLVRQEHVLGRIKDGPKS